MGHTVFKIPLICISAAVPTQGELGGRKPSPLEPDPAVEPAEPDASRTEPGEQGAVPRRTEAIHVRGPGDGGACRHQNPGFSVLGQNSPGAISVLRAGAGHVTSLSSLLPWSGSGFLQVVAVGFC